ncbi:hypothetical protein [Aquisalibacillus elongatus]|nr:hypothetical protein [Aquisalibacillus elongatus]
MVINQSGNLRKDYFVSYMKLLMNTMNCTVDEAKAITFLRIFDNNKHHLGDFSYQEFSKAYEELKD